MSVYTAVTIGPIVDTLSLTSSPAGLWGASYLFSWISRRMIHHLKEAGVSENRFISPCITLDPECEAMWKKGVGLFHDRIIFRSDGLEEPFGLVNTAKNETIEELTKEFSEPGQLNMTSEIIRVWLQNYIRIYATQQETGNPLLDLGAAISQMELEPHFLSQDQENLLLRLLEDGSKAGGQNSKVKKFLPNDRNADTWLLKGEGNSVRDLKDIAAAGASGSGRKYSQYYAVLYSDGDSMSKILERITDQDEKIREFSKNCLTFCAQAAQQVQGYGGVPLYAGGDDLLALLPVYGYHPETGAWCTIFGLVESLRELFNQNFQKYREELGGKPTISMGISIQYYKSPLYEALEQARNLLFDDSKHTKLKNACCIHLQKHSGQSVKLCEEWMDYDGKENLFATLDKLLRETEQKEDPAVFLAGAGATVEQFRELFCRAMEDQGQDQDQGQGQDQTQVALHNLYENLFDNADQVKFKEYLQGLEELTVQLVRKARDNVEKVRKNAVESICNSVFQARVGATVEQFKELLSRAIEDPDQTQGILHHLYENLFDRADLEERTVWLFQKVRDAVETVENVKKDVMDPEKIVTQLQYVIRVLHFMKEKGSEET